MAGHANSGQRKPDPACDLHVNHGKRDRDAQPAIDHVIEERVPRIVVIVAVAAQPCFFKQHSIQSSDGSLGVKPWDGA